MNYQEYWDACLIKTWRNAGTLLDAITMFKSITNKNIKEIEPKLKRIPQEGYPYKIQIRVFVADHLSKISKRLWEQAPEKDVLLLRKLKDSKFDTENDVINDNNLKAEQQRLSVNKLRVGISTLSVSNANHDTNWNVTKSNVQRRRMK